MFRKFIAKMLRLETRETMIQLAKDLTDSRQLEEHLKEHIKKLQEEITFLKENEVKLNNKIVSLENCTTSDGVFSQTEIYIEELQNNAEEPFLPQVEPNTLFIPEESPSVRIGYGQKSYGVKKNAPIPNPITPFIPIKATESVSFLSKEKIPQSKFPNPKVQEIISKLAKININVKYSFDQYLLISKNGDTIPLKDRFTTLDVYGEFVLLLTDVRNEHAAFSLQMYIPEHRDPHSVFIVTPHSGRS